MQQGVVDGQVHRRHRYARCLGQRRGGAQQRLHRLLRQRLPLLQQLHQGGLDRRFALLVGEVQDPHIFLVRAGRLLRHQGVIGPAIRYGRIQLFAVHVTGERSRLPHQPADDVSVIDPMFVRATQARHPLHHLLGVPNLDVLQAQTHLHLLADQPCRHRVNVLLYLDRAAPPHAHAQPFQRLQALGR